MGQHPQRILFYKPATESHPIPSVCARARVCIAFFIIISWEHFSNITLSLCIIICGENLTIFTFMVLVFLIKIVISGIISKH